MESVAAERLNKIGIRDHNIANASASDNEATSLSQDGAPDVSAIVSALAQQQSEAESDGSEDEGLRQRRSVNGLAKKNGQTTTTSDPSSLHLVAKDLHQVGRMIIQTTSLLPRPRSESCFSTMESEDAQENSRKRSPKKELAMTMLNLPLNPLKRKLLHHHSSIHKSETTLSPPNAEAEHHHHSKSPFLSLKTPPAVLTQPNSSLYPGTKKVKKGASVTTPLANVPPPPPPGITFFDEMPESPDSISFYSTGTLPGYYMPPRHTHTSHHTPAATPTTSPSAVTHRGLGDRHHGHHHHKSHDKHK